MGEFHNNGAEASFHGPDAERMAKEMADKLDVPVEQRMSFNVKDENGNLHDVSHIEAVIVNGRIFRPEV